MARATQSAPASMSVTSSTGSTAPRSPVAIAKSVSRRTPHRLDRPGEAVVADTGELLAMRLLRSHRSR